MRNTNFGERKMKKRLLASLLSVTLAISNLGISTYAMEEADGVNVVQEEMKEAEMEKSISSNDIINPVEVEEIASPNDPIDEKKIEEIKAEGSLLLSDTTEPAEIEEETLTQILEEEISDEDTESYDVQSAETVLTYNSDLRRAVASAKDGDTINLNGYTLMVNDENSNSEPWLIDKEITIKNGRIDLRAGGILLGDHVTFDGISLVFANPARNVIAANGYTLTLHNTTRALNSFGGYSAQNIHLFCGTMYDSSGIIGKVRIPASGSKGEIIITGQDIELGNIYAGNISTTAEGTVSNIPAEITVNVTGNSTIGMGFNGTLEGGAGPFNVNSGIYAGGAIETPAPGLTLNTNYIQCPPLPMDSANIANVGVNASVTVNLTGVNDNTVRYVYGDTYGTGETTVKYTGNDTLVSYLTLIAPRKLEIISGKLAPSSQSDLYYSSVSVAEGSYLCFTYLGDETLDDFTGMGGTIVLKPEQTLTIEGMVTGQSYVGIGSSSYQGGASSSEPIIDRPYLVTYAGSGQDAFSLLPYAQNTKIKLINENGFMWVAKEDGGTVEPEEPSVFTVTDSEQYDIPGAVVGTSIQPIDLSDAPKGGVEPYFYFASNLPEGITLDENTGIISGTPTKAGALSEAVITITDSAEEPNSAEIRIVIGEIKEEEAVLDEVWKIRNIEIKEGYERVQTVPNTQIVYQGFDVTATDGSEEFNEFELSWLPIQFEYNGTSVLPIGEEEEYYYYLITINHKDYILEFIGTDLYIHENDGIAGLPEGIYEFEMIIPQDAMENNQEKRLSFTIISGEQQEKLTDAAEPVVESPEKIKEYGLNDSNAEIFITAESTDEGILSYQWYKNTINSTEKGEKIEGANEQTYSPSTVKAGTFYYYCEVTNTNEDATGEKTAVTVSEVIQVKVNKGAGTGRVSMDDWIYGEKAENPVVESLTNETENVIYIYSGVEQDGTVYDASEQIPTEAGNYKVEVTLRSNEDYEEITVEDGFVIRQKEINISEVKVEDKPYNGTTEAMVNLIVFSDSSQKEISLVLDKDYTVHAEFSSPEKGTDIETRVTVVLLNSNYHLENTVYLASGNIVDAPKGLWVAGIEDHSYTGKAVVQEKLAVYHHTRELLLNQDYTVKYKNNVKAGTATITITGKGNYSGMLTETFSILPLDISEAILSEKEVMLRYNGKVQKATVTVSYMIEGKEVKLKAGTDFTFVYPKTNVSEEGYDRNAFLLMNEDPGYQVEIVGKGNYEGKTGFIQKITSKTLLSKLSLTKIPDQKYSEFEGEENGATPQIILKNGNTVLIPAEKGDDSREYDYTVEYRNNKSVGTATVILQANPESKLYSGTRTATFKITGIALSKAKMSDFLSTVPWTGSEIKQKVKFVYTTGSGDKKAEHILEEGVDYKTEYLNNKEVGTATVIYTGMGGYTGTIKKTFKITGTPINKVTVTGLEASMDFAGKEVRQQGYELTYCNTEGEEYILQEADEFGNGDYIVSYKNNHKAGTASITFTGVNGYTGKITKSFKITAYDLNQDKIQVELNNSDTYPYVKGGVFPEPVLTYTEGENVVKLIKGTDYTVSYSNHKNIGSKDDPKKAPTIKITGKGAYKGKIEVKFSITKGSLAATGMKITAADIVYQEKANLCKPVITIYDTDGKKLVPGTDYEKEFSYTYAEDTYVDYIENKIKNEDVMRRKGEPVQAGDIIPLGTEIKAILRGMKCYEGSEAEEEFAYVKAMISKASVTIQPKIYKGEEIQLEENDLVVKIGGEVLAFGRDFEIVEYTNHMNKGTAKVILCGIGNYGGEKAVSFKIDPHRIN